MSPPYVASSVHTGSTSLAPARVRALSRVDHLPAEPPTAPPPTVSGFDLHASRARNGRQCGASPTEPLALRWRAPLDPRVAPEGIFVSGGFLSVVGEVASYLFSSTGDPIGKLARLERLIAFDPRNAVVKREVSDVLWVDPWSDVLLARATLFRVGAARHTDLLVTRARLYAVGDSMPSSADDDEPMIACVLESTQPGDSAAGEKPRRERALRVATRRIVAAATEAFVAVATSGAIDVFSPSLDHLERFDTDALPVALSASEHRLAVVVQRAAGAALWVLSNDGLLCDVPVPSAPAVGHGPPLIGLDHRVYVPSAEAITVVQSEGFILDRYAVARFVGAAIDAADTLLVCDGSRLLAYVSAWESGGEAERRATRRVVLYVFGDETLRAAPVVTATGDVYCVTDSALYCLGPHS